MFFFLEIVNILVRLVPYIPTDLLHDGSEPLNSGRYYNSSVIICIEKIVRLKVKNFQLISNKWDKCGLKSRKVKIHCLL